MARQIDEPLPDPDDLGFALSGQRHSVADGEILDGDLAAWCREVRTLRVASYNVRLKKCVRADHLRGTVEEA